MIIYMKYYYRAFIFMSPWHIVHHNNSDWWPNLDVKDLLKKKSLWCFSGGWRNGGYGVTVDCWEKKKSNMFFQHRHLWSIAFQTAADVCLSSSVVYAAHNVHEDTREKLAQRPFSTKSRCRVACMCEGLGVEGFASPFMYSIGTLLSPIM